MTQQQSQAIKDEVNKVVQAEQAGGFLHMLEDPMWQAVFASVTTIGMFGFVLSGIWVVNAAIS